MTSKLFSLHQRWEKPCPAGLYDNEQTITNFAAIVFARHLLKTGGL